MKSHAIKTEAERAILPIRMKPYWHEIAPNRHLGVCVHKRASWVVRCRTVSNEYIQRTISPCEPHPHGINYDEARVIADELFLNWSAKKFVKLPEAISYNGEMIICPVGDVYTIGHALKSYLNWKQIAAAPTHFASVLCMINYHIVPRLAGLPLTEFNRDHLHTFCIDVLRTPPKLGLQLQKPKTDINLLSEEQLRKRKKTVNTLISILRGAFQMAWENGNIDNDRSWRCLRLLPNYDRPRLLFLTHDQCHRLMEVAEPGLRRLILGALYSGCRVSELKNLTVRDVGDQCHGIHICRPKNYRSRFVILPDEGLAYFLSLCDAKTADEPVFTNPKGMRWGDHHKYLFVKAVRTAGLSNDVVFHSLRHTYASLLLQKGATLTVLARQLGHADTKTVYQIYGHLTANTTLDELDRFFEGFGVLDKTEVQTRLTPMQSFRAVATARMPETSPSWPMANHSKHRGELAGLGRPYL
jgi:integrase/recombinase XerD